MRAFPSFAAAVSAGFGIMVATSWAANSTGVFLGQAAFFPPAVRADVSNVFRAGGGRLSRCIGPPSRAVSSAVAFWMGFGRICFCNVGLMAPASSVLWQPGGMCSLRRPRSRSSRPDRGAAFLLLEDERHLGPSVRGAWAYRCLSQCDLLLKDQPPAALILEFSAILPPTPNCSSSLHRPAGCRAHSSRGASRSRPTQRGGRSSPSCSQSNSAATAFFSEPKRLARPHSLGGRSAGGEENRSADLQYDLPHKDRATRLECRLPSPPKKFAFAGFCRQFPCLPHSTPFTQPRAPDREKFDESCGPKSQPQSFSFQPSYAVSRSSLRVKMRREI